MSETALDRTRHEKSLVDRLLCHQSFTGFPGSRVAATKEMNSVRGRGYGLQAVIAHVAREMTQVRLLLKRTKRLMLVANLSRARLVF
jgi:hypothetical protein